MDDFVVIKKVEPQTNSQLLLFDISGRCWEALEMPDYGVMFGVKSA